MGGSWRWALPVQRSMAPNLGGGARRKNRRPSNALGEATQQSGAFRSRHRRPGPGWKASAILGRMPLTRFTIRQLEALVTAAELHSFSGASERLGLTAQAVSQLVAELEAVLGFRLFDRTTRRVALTSAGRDF